MFSSAAHWPRCHPALLLKGNPPERFVSLLQFSNFIFPTEHIIPGEQLGGSRRRLGGRSSKLQKQNPAHFMFCVSSYQFSLCHCGTLTMNMISHWFVFCPQRSPPAWEVDCVYHVSWPPQRQKLQLRGRVRGGYDQTAEGDAEKQLVRWSCLFGMSMFYRHVSLNKTIILLCVYLILFT